MVTVLFGGVPTVDVPWHAPGCTLELTRPADDIDRAIAVLSAAGLLGPDRVSVGLIPTEPGAERDHRHAG